jgi:hypothetical protein
MRKIYAFCVLILAFFSAQGQNLVPNPSFEDTTSTSQHSSLIICKTQVCSSVWWCTNWFAPTKGSPDYYNRCSGDSQNNVPKNFMGQIQPHSGNAYAGAGMFGGTWYRNQREYIADRLTSPLVSGKNYDVKFYVALADSAHWTINGIGAYLSTDTTDTQTFIVLPIFKTDYSSNIVSM